ncbi:Surface antigen [Sphingobium faniae]|nr:Surface antigen [Sphingobium faniae]
MIGGFRALFAAVMLALGALIATPATAGVLQCVPFARQVSGIELYGNAHSWWSQAEGRYDRGHEPRVGAVLAFSSSRAMPVGHVAMVSKVVSDREVLLTHANWSYRGGIERNVRAIDVSPNNDWTDVRVWYGPIGKLGLRSNPARGFIYAHAPRDEAAGVQFASADRATAGADAARGAY